MEIQNAIIKGASLSIADHGLLSGWLYLEWDGSAQGFGGWRLYGPTHWKAGRETVNSAGHWIWRVLEIAGVKEWSELEGQAIRIKADMSSVKAIGHFLKDDWFNPTEEFATANQKGGD